MTNPEEEEEVDVFDFWQDIINAEPTEQEQEEYHAFCDLINSDICRELGWEYRDGMWYRGDSEFDYLPDYLHDLNLCQHFYEDLREDEEIQYANILTALLNNGIIFPGVGFRPCPLIFATAWQRCQAFAILREL